MIVTHCKDANCTAANTNAVDTEGFVGQYPSLILDAIGNPVISYHDAGNKDLKLVHCGNANCTAGNNIATVDALGHVGQFTSLELDASGNPVISYYGGDISWLRGDLKLAHCKDPNCGAAAPPTPTPTPEPGVDSDGDGCSDAQENGPSATSGGQRDPLYFWDFFDVYTGDPPVRDRAVTAGDIGAIVARFGTFHEPPLTKEDALAEALTPPTNLTGYHPAFDRSGSDPEANVWNLLPPDGSIAGGDIGAVVVQFAHTCA
jgi:hypothetical protein